MCSKGSFNELPEWKQWDHAIELTPGSRPFSMKVCLMSPIEQKELDDFLKENLASGCICPSKSLMASPVIVCPAPLHLFLKPQLSSQCLGPSPNLLAQPLTHVDYWSIPYSLSWTLVCILSTCRHPFI